MGNDSELDKILNNFCLSANDQPEHYNHYKHTTIAAINRLYLPRTQVVEAIGDGELATETEYGIAEIIKIGHRDELRVQIRKELGL
jgi:hypothetical protein